MKKIIDTWSVRQLEESYFEIEFPDYQRDPNLWSLVEKQRLIDSMTRRFDIASLYFYRHRNGTMDCVDGRQRIGAIMSFLGNNVDDKHNKFQFQILNEIYSDDKAPYQSLHGKSFGDIRTLARDVKHVEAHQFVHEIMEYPITVILLAESRRPEEFNLQFTRLNLGTIINAGEKLHAMVGDLRDECFERIGLHAFLANSNIPTRRFAREMVSAQILAQVFSLDEVGDYTRTRHFDLQRLFKTTSEFTSRQRELVSRLDLLFNLLENAFEVNASLRNRAITVSTVLLAWSHEVQTPEEASHMAEFVDEFVARLMWQVRKGLLIDTEYHYLADFQRIVSQASAERYSVASRAATLDQEFDRWGKESMLRGDAEWMVRNPGLDPRIERQTRTAIV